MSEQNTYRLFEIIKADTSVIEVSAGEPRFIIQLLDKDSRTAADRARAEKARQDLEELLQDVGNFEERLVFLSLSIQMIILLLTFQVYSLFQDHSKEMLIFLFWKLKIL